MPSILKCCTINTVFGTPLKYSVVMVGICSIVIASIALFASLGTILSIANKELVYNSNPVNAINMIFALFCTSTSSYQAIISVMLLQYGRWRKGSPFVLSLWFVSHVALIVLYSFMFLARSIICFHCRHPMQSLFTFVGGCFYDGVFIYFCVIVNSYQTKIEPDIIYY